MRLEGTYPHSLSPVFGQLPLNPLPERHCYEASEPSEAGSQKTHFSLNCTPTCTYDGPHSQLKNQPTPREYAPTDPNPSLFTPPTAPPYDGRHTLVYFNFSSIPHSTFLALSNTTNNSCTEHTIQTSSKPRPPYHGRQTRAVDPHPCRWRLQGAPGHGLVHLPRRPPQPLPGPAHPPSDGHLHQLRRRRAAPGRRRAERAPSPPPPPATPAPAQPPRAVPGPRGRGGPLPTGRHRGARS